MARRLQRPGIERPCLQCGTEITIHGTLLHLWEIDPFLPLVASEEKRVLFIV